jgi:hypothetical protein
MKASPGFYYILLRMQETALVSYPSESRRDDCMLAWCRHLAVSIDLNINAGLKPDEMMASA